MQKTMDYEVRAAKVVKLANLPNFLDIIESTSQLHLGFKCMELV